MARLEWGAESGFYDLGLDRGVLYLNDTAVPWNGLVSVDETDTGEVITDLYFEGQRLYIHQITGDFNAKISAYTYPAQFSEYNGYGPEERYQRFGLSYRTQHDDGHQLHIVYNALVLDDQRSWKTVANTIDPLLFAWDVRCAAIPIPGASPASHLIMEIPQDDAALAVLEDILYGTEDTEPRLPLPEELIELFESMTLLRIVNNGDGTYTASGPDDIVTDLGDGRFEINAPSVVLIDQGTFVVNSF